MSRLTIRASVTAILEASAKIDNFLEYTDNAPQHLKDLRSEIASVRVILSGLQRFVELSANIAPQRAALIPIQDVVTIMTQLVIVFSELETAVGDWTQRASSWFSWFLPTNSIATARLLNQLQRHKTSLSLVLQIIQWSVIKMVSLR